jgi:hypothetical protein
MRFVAIDVETANADMASICAVGAAVFDGSHWNGIRGTSMMKLTSVPPLTVARAHQNPRGSCEGGTSGLVDR